jgi:isopentenyl diphosphate isomerase/L-lactate dehydrogenase-like FMN-dependent dehydrogenase
MCLSTAATARPAEVAAAAPGAPRWFQVYVFADRSQTEDLIAEAVESDFSTLLLTVDTPYLGRRERDLRVDFKVPEHLTVSGDIFGGQFDTRVSWRDLEWLAGYDLPIVVKGILTAEDARLACEHGAAAIVVSNHGGRQLDGVSSSLDALEEVVKVVEGRAKCFSTGRSPWHRSPQGTSWGARVLIGRAMLWGLVAGGAEGASCTPAAAARGGRVGLALLGCASPADVTRAA